MPDILLTKDQSEILILALLSRRPTAQPGDGMKYYISDSNPLWKDLTRNFSEVEAFYSTARYQYYAHHYSWSFEGWFSDLQVGNLCQTRIIPTDSNCHLRITMGDGWEDEVYQNVIMALKRLGVL